MFGNKYIDVISRDMILTERQIADFPVWVRADFRYST
jgi:hypothetical protein